MDAEATPALIRLTGAEATLSSLGMTGTEAMPPLHGLSLTDAAPLYFAHFTFTSPSLELMNIETTPLLLD